MRKKFLLVCIVLLVGFLMFWNLGRTTLTNWDEAWFGAVAQSMVERGDYLVGFWNGEPWFYEPPLVTWFLALLMRLGLSSEFWLRLPVALSGVGVVWLTYKLATFMTSSPAMEGRGGRRPGLPYSRRIGGSGASSRWITGIRLAAGGILHSMKVKRPSLGGLIAVLVLLSNIEFLFRARQINVYVPLTLFLLSSLYAAYRRSLWSFVTLGLAFLTARVTAVLALPAIGYILFSKHSHPVDKKVLVKGWGLFLLIAGFWYFLNYWQFGEVFIRNYFLGYTLAKVKTINPGSGMSLMFYVDSLRHAFKLWMPVLPLALGWSFWRAKRNWYMRGLIVYVVVFLVVLTAAANKASWFMLPAYPILAMMVGVALVNWGGERFRALVLLGTGLIFLFQVFYWRDLYMVPETTRHQVQMAQKAKDLTYPGETIYLDDDYLPVAVFYSQRQVRPLRFNRLVDESWGQIDLPSGSLVLSNTETAPSLRKRSQLPLIQVDQVADLLLLRVERDSGELEGGDKN